MKGKTTDDEDLDLDQVINMSKSDVSYEVDLVYKDVRYMVEIDEIPFSPENIEKANDEDTYDG